MRVGVQAPDLGCAETWLGVVTVGVEGLAVDGPAGASPVENKAAGDRGCRSGQLLALDEPGRHGGVVFGLAGDVKPHHLAGRAVTELVGQGHLGTDRVAGEVDDDVESFGLGDLDPVVVDRFGQQSHITADLDERRLLAGRLVEREAVAACIGGVEDPQTGSGCWSPPGMARRHR